MRTVPKGAAHIRFVDGTDLRIGGSSELVLDEFVYDAAGGAGAFTTNMTKGILRMVTGKLAKQGIQIRTPSALIGVRGTDFIVAVLASGATIVPVLYPAWSRSRRHYMWRCLLRSVSGIDRRPCAVRRHHPSTIHHRTATRR